jgi:hypothetical protein
MVFYLFNNTHVSSIKEFPTSLEARHTYAALAALTASPTHALKITASTRQKFHNDLETLKMETEILILAGKYREARAVVTKAVRTWPWRGDIWNWFAKICEMESYEPLTLTSTKLHWLREVSAKVNPATSPALLSQVTSQLLKSSFSQMVSLTFKGVRR